MLKNNKYGSFWLEHAVEKRVMDCYGGSANIGKGIAIYSKNEAQTE